MKVLKRIGLGAGALVVLLAAALAVSAGYHQWQLSREDAHLDPPGVMVDVEGHRLHVYAEGPCDGADTGPALVFMSGGGTASPYLDFKPLFSDLSADHCVAVVEKAGYGYSDVGGGDRDVDTLLTETRAALNGAGVPGPYVLLPHSMSGIEALRWAQEHPDDVAGIIGLDPAVPASYDGYPIPHPAAVRLLALGAETGLTRVLPGVADSAAAIESGRLSEEEAAEYRTITHRRTLTADMRNELTSVETSAALVDAEGVPTVPMHLLVSNGEGTGLDPSEWRGMLDAYAAVAGGDAVHLDAGHYLHQEATEQVADQVRAFLEGL